jgi:hypothetical protein
MRFSSLTFRVTLIFLACASFLGVCESVRSKATLRGAVLVSEDTVFSISFESSALKAQVAPIPTWTALPPQYAGSVAAFASPENLVSGV